MNYGQKQISALRRRLPRSARLSRWQRFRRMNDAGFDWLFFGLIVPLLLLKGGRLHASQHAGFPAYLPWILFAGGILCGGVQRHLPAKDFPEAFRRIYPLPPAEVVAWLCLQARRHLCLQVFWGMVLVFFWLPQELTAGRRLFWAAGFTLALQISAWIVRHPRLRRGSAWLFCLSLAAGLFRLYGPPPGESLLDGVRLLLPTGWVDAAMPLPAGEGPLLTRLLFLLPLLPAGWLAFQEIPRYWQEKTREFLMEEGPQRPQPPPHRSSAKAEVPAQPLPHPEHLLLHLAGRRGRDFRWAILPFTIGFCASLLRPLPGSPWPEAVFSAGLMMLLTSLPYPIRADPVQHPPLNLLLRLYPIPLQPFFAVLLRYMLRRHLLALPLWLWAGWLLQGETMPLPQTLWLMLRIWLTVLASLEAVLLMCCSRQAERLHLLRFLTVLLWSLCLAGTAVLALLSAYWPVFFLPWAILLLISAAFSHLLRCAAARFVF